MPKKQRDTSWDLPAGTRETGLNNLTQALGSRSQEIVERLHRDPVFAKTASEAIIGLSEDKPLEPRLTMEVIKSIMGGRCFLPDEVESLLGLQCRETASLPKLTGNQIKKLLAFLKAPCPITSPILRAPPAAQTHILFPQPSIISGSTFSMNWVLKNARANWGMDFGGNSFDGPIPDRYFNQIRPSKWILMYWGPKSESAIPLETDERRLKREHAYQLPDLAEYILALGLLKKRGMRVRCIDDGHGSRATLLDGLHACRTSGEGLNVYPDTDKHLINKKPALIREVPLR